MFLGNGIVEFTLKQARECRPFTILKRYLYQIINFASYLCYCNNKYMFSVNSEPNHFNGGS